VKNGTTAPVVPEPAHAGQSDRAAPPAPSTHLLPEPAVFEDRWVVIWGIREDRSCAAGVLDWHHVALASALCAPDVHQHRAIVDVLDAQLAGLAYAQAGAVSQKQNGPHRDRRDR
jgi:hypothetical protein